MIFQEKTMGIPTSFLILWKGDTLNSSHRKMTLVGRWCFKCSPRDSEVQPGWKTTGLQSLNFIHQLLYHNRTITQDMGIPKTEFSDSKSQTEIKTSFFHPGPHFNSQFNSVEEKNVNAGRGHEVIVPQMRLQPPPGSMGHPEGRRGRGTKWILNSTQNNQDVLQHSSTKWRKRRTATGLASRASGHCFTLCLALGLLKDSCSFYFPNEISWRTGSEGIHCSCLIFSNQKRDPSDASKALRTLPVGDSCSKLSRAREPESRHSPSLSSCQILPLRPPVSQAWKSPSGATEAPCQTFCCSKEIRSHE